MYLDVYYADFACQQLLSEQMFLGLMPMSDFIALSQVYTSKIPVLQNAASSCVHTDCSNAKDYFIQIGQSAFLSDACAVHHPLLLRDRICLSEGLEFL